MARAMEMRCFCPPLRLTPRSPNKVSYRFREACDVVVDVGILCRLLDLGHGRVIHAKGNVGPD